MTIESTGTSYHVEETDSTETPGEAEFGDGGGTLGLWTKNRMDMLAAVQGKTFTNSSSFDIPSAVTSSNYHKNWENNEKVNGIYLTGTILSAEETPLAGTIYVFDEATGELVSSQEIAGAFIRGAEPPSGATTGEGVSGSSSYEFVFTPSMPGLNFRTGGITVGQEVGNITYGAIDGTVTDYKGDPLPEERVEGSGAYAKTDENGYYQLTAPGNTDVTVRSLGMLQDISTTGGVTTTQDWQAARLTVEVVTPDLRPVSGSVVQIGDKTYKSDEDGLVVLDVADIRTYEILVGNEYYAEAPIQLQGEDHRVRIGDGTDKYGVDLSIIDAETGSVVWDLPAMVKGTENRTTSDQEGNLRIFTDDPEEVIIEVGRGDPRYDTVTIAPDLVAGSTVEYRVEVEPKQQVDNS